MTKQTRKPSAPGKPKKRATSANTKTAAPVIAGKLGEVVALLQRPQGASLGDLMKKTGWQAHSVRGALSGALKRERGLSILSEKTPDGRVYKISPNT